MAKITRIKAHDEAPKKEKPAKTKEPAKKEPKKVEKPEGKKPFILIRPFVAFFRYLRDAWKEIRQVRWPNRKATWKMLVAVLIYTAVFVLLITLLDLFFSWLFGLILGNK